jgi:hypothetical protein
VPNGTAEEWEAGWRKSVDGRLTSFDAKLDTLVDAVQRLVTRLTLTENAIGEIRDTKRAAPRLTQGWLEIGLMLLFGLVTMLCNGTALAIGLFNLLRAIGH